MTYFVDDVGAEHDLAEVVDDEEDLEVVGRPVLHGPRPVDLDDVHVAGHDEEGGEGALHEEPAILAGVAVTPYVVVPLDEGRVDG